MTKKQVIPPFVCGLLICTFLSFISGPSLAASSKRPLTEFPALPDRYRTADSLGPITAPDDEPVVVVAGWGALPTDIWYWPLFFQLWASGYSLDDIHAVFPEYLSALAVDSPRFNAKVLARKVQSVVDSHNTTEVDIIAHSMGGLASRWYVERMDGAYTVDDLVTLGTPHQGNMLASYFTFTQGAQDMLPGSEFLAELDTDTISPDVHYINVWSTVDDFYFRQRNAQLPSGLASRKNVDQVRYDYVLHLGLPTVTYNELTTHLD
jgi:triacylglycerol lipase